MKKLLCFLLLTLCLVVSAALIVSCGDDETQTTPASTSSGEPSTPETAAEVRILGLKGPTGMGMAQLYNTMTNNPDSRYKVSVFASPDLVKTEILMGNYDIAALPTNVAAALYNSGKADLKIAAVNTLGVLYLLENGNSVTDWNSLKGKTIYCAGGGSTPEYVLRYLLSENGLDPDNDVTLDFSFSDHAEVAAFLSKPDTVVMLPEPNVTSALTTVSEARIVMDLTEEWNKVSDSSLMQGCIVVRRAFAEQYPEQLMAFLDDYRASVDFVNQNPDAASDMIVNAGIIPKKPVALQAIPRCHIVYIEGTEMNDQLSGFLTVLFEADPTSVGGKVPDDGFYYFK